MRSAILGLGLGCLLFSAQPTAAESLVREGAAAAGGTAGAMAGGVVGGPIGGALGGVVGGALGRGAVGMIGAMIPGGDKSKKNRSRKVEVGALQAESPPPVLAVQPREPASPAMAHGDAVSVTALDAATDSQAPLLVVQPAAPQLYGGDPEPRL